MDPGDSEAAAAPEPPSQSDIDTQPHDLRQIVGQLAKERNQSQHLALSFERKANQPIQLELEKKITYVGRNPKCDIVLEKPDVSSRHVRISKTEAGYFEIMDLRSTNGTLVEGTPISRMILMSGDSFSIAGIRFVVGHAAGGEE